MKKSVSTLIDELIVTNIKIFHLVEKMEKNKQSFSTNKHSEDAKKLQDLSSFRSEIYNALNRSKAMKKSIATLIDELTVTNLKIYHLVDKIEKNKHTRKDAKKAHDLNKYRSELCNALNREFKERENIKV